MPLTEGRRPWLALGLPLHLPPIPLHCPVGLAPLLAPFWDFSFQKSCPQACQ